MRIKNEKKTVEAMIRLYCRKHEGNSELCPNCKHLLNYAMMRLDKCPHGNQKPTCKKCPIHCYRKDEREQIRRIMRYSGPRMILYHPLKALRHIWRELL